MISNKAKDKLFDSITEETLQAISNHGYFKNEHEMYAVLLEEIAEANDALMEVFLEVKGSLWDEVRIDGFNCTQLIMEDIYNLAFQLLQESCQVCAVANKYLIGVKRNGKN